MKMDNIISCIHFIDKQNQTDNIYKFVLIYQDLDTQCCMLRPLTSICAKEVAHVLIDIFSILRVPGILKCRGDTMFPNQLASHLYNQDINIIVICENIEIYNSEHPTENIIKVVSEMLDTWSMVNETNKWVEGLDIVQFQKNHNIYYEATHVPMNCNNVDSLNSKQCVTQLKSITQSMCNMNTQAKNRKTILGSSGENILENNLRKETHINDQTEIDLPLILDHEEDNDKYEIIEEILDKLVNPISSLMEIHDKDLPRLFQKPTIDCSITEALHEHDKCSEFNTTSELEKKAAWKYLHLEGLQKQENFSDYTIVDKKLPQFEQKTAQEYSNLEDLQDNKKYSKSYIAYEIHLFKKCLPKLVQESVQECSNLEDTFCCRDSMNVMDIKFKAKNYYF